MTRPVEQACILKDVTEPDQTWATWTEWLDAIRVQIAEAHVHRAMWRTLVELIEEGGHPHRQYFVEPFSRMYVDSQAMAVQRQADTDPGSVSIARLLSGLGDRSGIATRQRFFGLWELDAADNGTEFGAHHRRFLEERAAKAWERFAHRDRPDHLDPAIPRQDRERLTEMAVILGFANRSVAHTDAGAPPEATSGDLDRAIDLLGELYRKYCLLLTGSGPTKDALEPVSQADWLGPFRRPLL